MEQFMPITGVQEYLEDFREQLGVPRNNSNVCYVSMNKDSHVLEVPEDLAERVPNIFNACAGKRGVKRFLSDDLQDLNSRLNETQLAVEAAQNSILSRITASSIGDKRDMWLEVRCMTRPYEQHYETFHTECRLEGVRALVAQKQVQSLCSRCCCLRAAACTL